MALPDLSSSMYVAQLRFIQFLHEGSECRNPDTLVKYFIPIRWRLRGAWLSRKKLSELRADPFYYYLVARTKHYDQVVSDAVSNAIQRIVSVGAGSDTRPYRFMELFRSKDVKIMECDQEEAIYEKQRIARRFGPSDRIDYLPIDLNADSWPDFAKSLGDGTAPKTLVLIEGVSPYINDSSFPRFLRLLATKLPEDSLIAYDFKIRGIKDDFGRNERTQRPFRLSSASDEVAAFHRTNGLLLDGMELSSELCARLLPAVAKSGATLFKEDGLVQLRVKRS